MDANEIKAELDRALMVEYPHYISESLLMALRSCIKKITSRVLQIPNTEYCLLLDEGRTTFNYHQIAILTNNFHNFPFGHFEDLGFTLEDYKNFYDEIIYLVAEWEGYVQPYRKTFNKKMEILSNSNGKTGPSNLRRMP